MYNVDIVDQMKNYKIDIYLCEKSYHWESRVLYWRTLISGAKKKVTVIIYL